MKKIIKWILFIVIAFIVLAGVVGSNDPKTKEAFEKGKEVGSLGYETTKSEEKFNLVVTSQIVKKVDSKYRYFFDIRNKDTKDFEGVVTISVFNQLGNNIWDNTFKTESPIKPNLGDSVYFDINTGPESVHGENGISTFKYTVKINDQIVTEGKGEVTTKLEVY